MNEPGQPDPRHPGRDTRAESDSVWPVDRDPPDLRVPRSQIGKKRGVVGVITRGDRFLVIRRSQQVTAPGKLCLPGGTMEQGETEVDTLVREMKEELDLVVAPLRLCWRSITPWGTTLAWWRASIDDDVTPQPDPLEVADFFWMTAREMETARDALPSLPAFVAAVAAGEIKL